MAVAVDMVLKNDLLSVAALVSSSVALSVISLSSLDADLDKCNTTSESLSLPSAPLVLLILILLKAT